MSQAAAIKIPKSKLSRISVQTAERLLLERSGCSDPKAPGSLMEGARAAPATPLSSNNPWHHPPSPLQDPGFPEGATHGGEADQCHQGDPGGHQERGSAERLLCVTRWARAWLRMRGITVPIVFKVPSCPIPNLWCSMVGGGAGAAGKGAAGLVLWCRNEIHGLKVHKDVVTAEVPSPK